MAVEMRKIKRNNLISTKPQKGVNNNKGKDDESGEVDTDDDNFCTVAVAESYFIQFMC